MCSRKRASCALPGTRATQRGLIDQNGSFSLVQITRGTQEDSRGTPHRETKRHLGPDWFGKKSRCIHYQKRHEPLLFYTFVSVSLVSASRCFICPHTVSSTYIPEQISHAKTGPSDVRIQCNPNAMQL